MVDLESDPVRPDSAGVRPAVSDPEGVLKKSRELLDLFWEISKPDRDTRLQAAEKLLDQLRISGESDELKYVVKRLVNGLSHSRDYARTGFSATLAQVLSVFENLSLKSTLDQIKEKHDLQTANKKQIRNVAFGNFFGVLALSQSTRLHKEPQVLLECVKLLQTLSQYRDHLRELPRKTMVDILSETSEDVFEEVLFSAIQTDLTSALSSPEQLELLLVAMQKFPSVIKPAKLKKLLGTANIISKQTLPRLLEVLKTAARSVKKESVLPSVALDLLQVSLRENSFELFWKEAVITGLLPDRSGPYQYLAFRLLGASLPLLSVSQLQFVLSGEVMKSYGEHVVSAQLPERFKFSPEMDVYVSCFLQSCKEQEKQLKVVVAFTLLTHQGYPAVPSFWKVVEHMEPVALQQYVEWLKEVFCKPQLDKCLEFSTRKEKVGQETPVQKEDCLFRFRKWIIPRLTSIIENHQIKKDEELVMSISRFIFYHGFFITKKKTSEIPETQRTLSVPLDPKTRNVISTAFYNVLQYLNVLPVLGDSAEGEGESEVVGKKRVLGVMMDGSMWVYRLVEYADSLLKQEKYVQSAETLTEEHIQAWNGMLDSVETLMKKMKKTSAPEHTAFQHLFLIIGIQIFKAPDDSVELLKDLRSCMEKAQSKKSKKKKKETEGEQEPHWVEVVVEILLSLLSQPSRLIRSVCKTAFSRICPYITQPALSAIISVLDPNKNEEESGVVVTDEKEGEKKKQQTAEEEVMEEDEEADGEDKVDSDSSSDDDDDDEEDEEVEQEEEVDQNFRLELMKVLQGQNALAIEEDGSEDEEEMDDEAMMKLDESLATLFGEQKKKLQAKKDEKERIRREKTLVRDFKIKVLDLVEVFLMKQGSSSLVIGMVEPLLSVIENSMSSDNDQQEVDFLRRAAAIFRNQLCRGKQYCRDVEGREAELHEMLERLIGRAQKLQDSSVALYYFSAALYVVKVLRGVMKESVQESSMGKVDVERVTRCFRDALSSFMSRRKSPLTAEMFLDLFNRFPVLCVNLLDTVVENITAGVREHQQGQACVMLMRALQSKEVKQMMSVTQLTELCQKSVEQLCQCLQNVESKNKAVHEKTLKALEFCQCLIKTVHTQNVEVNLETLRNTLRSMNADGSLQKTGQLEDTYWNVLKLFGIQKPKVEKVKKAADEQPTEQEATKKKKKGFLPESKKRKNRKKPQVLEGKDAAAATETAAGAEGGKKKKKKKNKKRKGQGGGGGAGGGGGGGEAQPPAKKAKTQPPQSKKQKGGGGRGGQASVE